MFYVVAIKDFIKLLCFFTYLLQYYSQKDDSKTFPPFIDGSHVFTGDLSDKEIEPRTPSGEFKFLACSVC